MRKPASNSTRKIALCAYGIAISVVLAACAKDPSPKPKATLYSAQQIITMDPSQPVATAVAVSEGKIIAVGDVDLVSQAIQNYDVSHEPRFENQILMPGFIENHLHPTLAGILLPSVFITPWDWDLPSQSVTGVQGRSDYLSALQAALQQHNSQEVFITWGYHQYFHGDISRADLDVIAPDFPVIVWHRSFHEIIANSAAMTALQIDAAALKDHPAINLEKGHFWEMGLFTIFDKLQPTVLNPVRYQAGVLEGLVLAQRNGITSVADQGFPLLNLDMERALLNDVIERNQIPLTVSLIGNGNTLSLDGLDKGLQRMAALPSSNTEQIQFLPKQVKLLADGAFYSQLMQMEDGYLDGHHGEWITTPERLAKMAKTFWQADYQLHIHVNGDKGLNVVLDIIEKLVQESPREHKTVLHHYGYSGADHAERLAELEVSVSANPYYLWALADKYAEVGLGPERAQYISRLGDLERNGVSVSLHSDLPMAPADPLRLAGVAATRITANGTALAQDERLSINTALRSITLDAARAIQQDHVIGSIEVGKQADFTILGSSPLTVPPEDWQDIEILGIVKNGETHLQSAPPITTH